MIITMLLIIIKFDFSELYDDNDIYDDNNVYYVNKIDNDNNNDINDENDNYNTGETFFWKIFEQYNWPLLSP